MVKNDGMPVKVALVGYGYWGQNLARVLASTPGCVFCAIADSDPKKLADAANKYPDVKLYSNHAEAISDPEVNAVVVATPVVTHYPIVKLALQASKHVLCEKVLCRQPAEVAELGQLAKANGLVLAVGHTFLHNSVVQHIQQSIAEKKLGDIYYLTFKRTGLGPIRADVDVLYDLAAHDISILYYWLGPPQWVICVAQSVLPHNKPDIALIQLGFGSGVVAHIQVSWINPMKQRLVEVVGSTCMMVFDDVSTTEKLRIIKTGKNYQAGIHDFGSFQLSVKDGDIIIPNITYPEPLRVEMNRFVQCVSEGKTPTGDLETADAVARTLKAIQHSINHNNSKVTLE